MWTWVSLRARRSSCSVISSAMRWAARASTFLRRAGLNAFLIRSRFVMALLPFLLLFDPGDMGVEAFIGLLDQLTIELFFAAARFVTGKARNSFAVWVESESHAP